MPTAQTRPMARQIATFAVVGVVNTGLYYGLYLLLLTRLPYLLAHVLAFLLSMVGSFFLTPASPTGPGPPGGSSCCSR